jgi:hypothetical protein
MVKIMDIKRRSLKYELVPMSKFDSIKRIENVSLAVNSGKVSVSSDSLKWDRIEFLDTDVLKPTILNNNFMCINKEANRFVSVDTDDKCIKIHDILPMSNLIHKGIVAGNNHIVIYNENSLFINKLDNEMNSISYYEKVSELAIDTVHFFNIENRNLFVVFYKDICEFSVYNTNINYWAHFKLSEIQDWKWSDITVVRDKIVCLNSIENKLLILDTLFRKASYIKIPDSKYTNMWNKLSSHGDYLSIINPRNESLFLLTYDFCDFYRMMPSKNIKKHIFTDYCGNVSYLVSVEDCEYGLIYTNIVSAMMDITFVIE